MSDQEPLAGETPADELEERDGQAVEVPTTAPLLAGTFAIYQDGRGGLVLVTDTAPHGVLRKHIPAALVKMATGGGFFGKRFAGIFGS